MKPKVWLASFGFILAFGSLGCMSVYAVQPWPCSRISEVQGLSDELLMMKGKREYPKARTYIIDSDAKCAADRKL